MALTIQSNTSGLFTVNQLRNAQEDLASSLEKIATGSRINKAADDASGMIIADHLGNQARSIGQAIINANDAMSLSQIADGALEESTNIIQTIRTKAVQAANGSQGAESVMAIQNDIDTLLGQLDTIARNTSYNGRELLSGDFVNQSFQVGANAGETVTISIGSAESGRLGDPELGSLSDINVLTAEGAQAAVEITDAALKEVGSIRSEIGSTRNQLSSTISGLSTTRINILSAESTIRDVDLAEESINLARLKRLSQARAYAAAQTNEQSSTIMKLLQG
ncbi:MAG: flagellin FliC [Desulfobacteraceae bacterium]|nr:MAG: flagellin FliC [Desulfobacteraceae bacterium]